MSSFNFFRSTGQVYKDIRSRPGIRNFVQTEISLNFGFVYFKDCHESYKTNRGLFLVVDGICVTVFGLELVWIHVFELVEELRQALVKFYGRII